MMLPAAFVLLGLLWEYDRTISPEQFTVILESTQAITGTQRALVAGVTEGTCTDLPPDGTATSFCTTLTCPGPGSFRLTIESTTYRTRSNTLTFQVHDAACTQIDGVTVYEGSASHLPAAQHCQATTQPPPPAPVEVTVPSTQTQRVAIPTPSATRAARPTASVIVAQRPHAAGSIHRPTPQAATPAVQPTATVPPPLEVTTTSGPSTTVTTTQPTTEPQGVVCP